jgi:DNA-binding beta-propeller fold protein YncE
MAELVVGSEIGGHRIEAVAGRGGMGVVYRATHLALNRTVALKLISPELAEDAEFRERFKRESEIAASLDHPNVVPIYHAGEDDGKLYVTMRFVEGTDLREMVALQGRLEPRVAARIISQTASALDAAHARGLVHRDVKPANVLIDESGGHPHAYLTDFGLTKQASSQSGLTKTGMIVGTMDYIAPEQLQGSEVDGRADIYALGCVFYQALTGQVPYPRDTEPAKMWAHMSEPTPSLLAVSPNLPPELDEVVQRAMAKEPDERYLSAGDFGRAAVAASEGQLLSRSERSVATGEAAPAGATAVGTAPPVTAGTTAMSPAPGTAPGATAMSPAAPATAPPGWGPPPGTPPGAYSPPSPPYGVAGPGAPGAAQKKNRLPLILGLGGGALALIVIALVVVLAGGGGGGSDAAGTVVGKPIPVGKEPSDIVAGEGALWTADLSGDTISKIDPKTNKAQQFPAGPIPQELAVGGGTVWVHNYNTTTITPVNAGTGAKGSPIETGGIVDGIAFGGGFVWVTHSKDGTVTRISPSSRKIDGPPIKVGRAPFTVAADDRNAYVANSKDNTISVIDAASGQIFADPVKLEDSPGGLELADGTLYVFQGKDKVVPIDEQSLVAGQPFNIAGGAVFTVGLGSAWVIYPTQNLIRRFSLEDHSEQGKPIEGVGKGATEMTTGENAVWVTTGKAGNSVIRIKPS